jgi:hypothetical protein
LTHSLLFARNLNPFLFLSKCAVLLLLFLPTEYDFFYGEPKRTKRGATGEKNVYGNRKRVKTGKKKPAKKAKGENVHEVHPRGPRGEGEGR